MNECDQLDVGGAFFFHLRSIQVIFMYLGKRSLLFQAQHEVADHTPRQSLMHPSAFASPSFYQLATHKVRGWLVQRLLYFFHVCLFVGWFVSVCLLVGL